MDKLIINGPCKLSGEVQISKSKNAYLPILAAVILNDRPVHLKNIPNLADIRTMIRLLENLGVRSEVKGEVTTFYPGELNSHEATYDLVKTMRASIFTLGPLIARRGEAKVSLPGGCAIGARPIDIHLANLKKLGVEIILDSGYVHALNGDALQGAHMALSFPSVGATENVMMAATAAKGTTVIENCAMEPEIDDLANFINAMGGDVSGIGTSKLTIKGPTTFKEVEYEAIGDRIEAATYVNAALMTESELTIKGFDPKHLEFVFETLREMGAKLDILENGVRVYPSKLKGCIVDTAPYPGFPTDVQAQLMALCLKAEGNSIISEKIFENRFMHVPELSRLGAKITLKGQSAIIDGGKKLKAAPVMCTDLRASAALVLAAMIAEGKSEILRIYHLDRGYENLYLKLKKIGADISREKA